jgi:hypothetical protein
MHSSRGFSENAFARARAFGKHPFSWGSAHAHARDLAHNSIYLPLGGLLPRLPPLGFPVLLGAF